MYVFLKSLLFLLGQFSFVLAARTQPHQEQAVTATPAGRSIFAAFAGFCGRHGGASRGRDGRPHGPAPARRLGSPPCARVRPLAALARLRPCLLYQSTGRSWILYRPAAGFHLRLRFRLYQSIKCCSVPLRKGRKPRHLRASSYTRRAQPSSFLSPS